MPEVGNGPSPLPTSPQATEGRDRGPGRVMGGCQSFPLRDKGYSRRNGNGFAPAAEMSGRFGNPQAKDAQQQFPQNSDCRSL